MKAMILAAGKGERMRPLSDVTPKPLLLIQNKPLIEYNIIALVQAGIKDIVINLHHGKDKIKAYLGNGQKYGANIHYSIEETLLNTGGGVANALNYLGGEPFIILSADLHTNYSFVKLPKKINGNAHIVLVDNPDYNEGSFSDDT